MADEKFSNSHKYKEEIKKREALPSTNVSQAKKKKKNEVARIAKYFISDDINTIPQKIAFDVVIPTVKKAILDSVDIMLYGNAGSGNKNSKTSLFSSLSASRINYENKFKSPHSTVAHGQASYDTYTHDDVIYRTRGEAEDVLSTMRAILEQYEMVSVADLYELSKLSSNYTDVNYGWKDLNGASIVHVRDGYMLKLPRAIVIK